MNCLKCNAENEFGNYCSNCGTQLKEKCPECGGMERVGRSICETLLKKIKCERNHYISQYYVALAIILPPLYLMLGFMSIPIIRKFYSGPLDARHGAAFGFVLIIVSAFILFPVTLKLRKKDEKEFARRHPEYAEIIRKVEEEEERNDKNKIR